MKPAFSLRVRMMLLFCVVVGVLLAASYFGFYLALRGVVRGQFDRRLVEAEAPVAADIQTDPNDADIVAMDIPGEYFETLAPSGRVVATSKNLNGRPIVLPPITHEFQTIRDPRLGRLRVHTMPVHRASGEETLLLAMPTHDIEAALERFLELVFFLLPCSLIIMAIVSAWYVGRSLAPIAALTEETSRMAERVRISSPGSRAGPGDPPRSTEKLTVPSANRDDELGRLAGAFNQLFICVDSALLQLRQFVSDASHELRTPLSVLQGETELLLKEPRAPEEYQQALGVIDSELKKLSRIVEALFTLAMADAGQLRLLHEPLYLNEVLEEACALATPRARTKEISIDRHLAEDIAYTGDETFLRQLFLIFLDNAVKYSAPRTHIRVDLAASNGNFNVRFQDEGVGIAPEHLPRIFERFFRAPHPDTPEAQSGGLGLAIAQAIVRAQGGAIECASRPGAGSTFTISLPRQPEEPPSAS